MLEHLNEISRPPVRVVILGGTGFVGAATRRELEDKGVPVLALGRADLDLLAADSADRLAGLLRTDDSLVVISAQAPAKNNAMLEANIRMMSSVCAALARNAPAHVVYISSDAVYADCTGPLTESSCAQPDSLHGVMHLTREIMLRNAFAGPLAFVRPTLIYGAGDPHNGYGPNRFRRLAEAEQKIVLFGDGEERRDHIHVDDVAALVVRTLMHKSRGILNAATGRVTSFKEVAELIVKNIGARVAIEGSPRVGPMPHNGYRAFDVSAVRTAFPGFEPTLLIDGLTRTNSIDGGKICKGS